MPDYHYLKPQPIGHQVIALGEFGGTTFDPVGAAWLGADGDQTEGNITLIEPEVMQ